MEHGEFVMPCRRSGVEVGKSVLLNPDSLITFEGTLQVHVFSIKVISCF